MRLRHFLLGVCEVINTFVCKDETAIVVLKVLGATIKNLVVLGPQALGICASLP